MPPNRAVGDRPLVEKPIPAYAGRDARCLTIVLNSTAGQDFKAEPPPRHRETEAVVRLSDELIASLRTVIESSPFSGLGPIEVARTLGVDKSFASRLMSALRASDPLVALSLLPGVVPLRQFVSA